MKVFSISEIKFLHNYLRTFDIAEASDAGDLSDKEAEEFLKKAEVKQLVSRETSFRYNAALLTPAKALYIMTKLAITEDPMRDEVEMVITDKAAAISPLIKETGLSDEINKLINPNNVREGDGLMSKILNAEEGLKIAKKLVGVITCDNTADINESLLHHEALLKGNGRTLKEINTEEDVNGTKE